MRKDVEELSEYIHNLWISWAVALIEEEQLSKKRLSRWKKCLCEYRLLSERMKDKDRKIARTILSILKKENV